MTNRAKLGIDGGAVHLKGKNQFSSIDMKDTTEDDQLYLIQDPVTGEMFSIKYSTTNSSSLHKDISNEFEFIPEKIIVDDEDWVIIEEAISGDKRKVQKSNFIGEDIYADEIKVRLDSLMEVDWSSSTYLNSFTINVMKLNEISELFIDSGINFNHEVKMGNNNIINLLDPVNDQDAATKKYVDDNSGAGYIDELSIHNGVTLSWNATDGSINSINIDHIEVNNILGVGGAGNDIHFLCDINMFGYSKIVALADPTEDQDAATKKYVDDNIIAYVDELLIHDDSVLNWDHPVVGYRNVLKIDIVETSVGLNTKFLGSVSGESHIICDTELSLNNHSITSVIDPTNDQDAATKKYVDDNSAGSDYVDELLIHDGSFLDWLDGLEIYGNVLMINRVELMKLGKPTSGPILIGGGFDMDNNSIINMSNPVNDQDAATSKWVDLKSAGFQKTIFKSDSNILLLPEDVAFNNTIVLDYPSGGVSVSFPYTQNSDLLSTHVTLYFNNNIGGGYSIKPAIGSKFYYNGNVVSDSEELVNTTTPEASHIVFMSLQEDISSPLIWFVLYSSQTLAIQNQ